MCKYWWDFLQKSSDNIRYNERRRKGLWVKMPATVCSQAQFNRAQKKKDIIAEITSKMVVLLMECGILGTIRPKGEFILSIFCPIASGLIVLDLFLEIDEETIYRF